MADSMCDKEPTAFVVIDPYNDFISEGGKFWDRLKAVAEPKHQHGAKSAVNDDAYGFQYR